MKKKMLNITSALVLIAAMVFSITGCSVSNFLESVGLTESPDVPSNIAVIISPTANEPRPDLKLAYDDIFNSSITFAYRSLIINDGSVYVVSIPDLRKADRTIGISDQNKKLDAEVYVDEFIKIADEQQALTPEKDTAKAIRFAADSLYNCDGDKTIVLIDNGISTTGLVKFKTFRGFDPEQAIAAFDDSDLPDLKNINIVWYGLGSSVAPQDELSIADLNNLKAFWECYLTRAGAASVRFDKTVTVNTASDNSSLPWVSTVEVTPTVSKMPDFVEVVSVALSPDNERDRTFEDALSVGIKLDETAVKFKPDSYELVDRNEAINKMTPFAEYLKANPQEEIVILGCTATAGSNDDCIIFSKGRADTIASIFSELGVNPSQVKSVGLGYEHEFHIPDLNADGSLNESAAKNNRCAIIIDANSASGKEYI